MRKIVAVVGDGTIDKDGDKYKLAFATGKALVDAGYRIQTGGMGGVMQAVFAGAHASSKYVDGDTIAIIPNFNRASANDYADIVIPTGLDVLRNALVVGANAVVAIGGGAGTLSEMAFAWTFKKLIVAYDSVDGWSRKLAGTRLDNKIRYEDIKDDRVYKASTPEEMISIINANIDRYNKYHEGIKWTKE